MTCRYTQDKAASAEIFRLILQKMAEHPAALNPSTYAVWYEFLTGVNPPLTEAMNKLLDGKGELTSEITQKLFDRYISEVDPKARDTFRLSMQRLLDNMSRFAESTESMGTSSIRGWMLPH
jgi:diguanylate cyclase